LVIDHIKPSEYVQYVRSFNASHYDQYIDQAESFVETAINSLESSPMLDQVKNCLSDGVMLLKIIVAAFSIRKLQTYYTLYPVEFTI
jgi:hypothetical protein